MDRELAPPIPDPPRTTGRLRPTVIALGWVSLLTDVASEMIYPLLPRFLDTTLGIGKTGLGFVEGLAETTAALARLPSGHFSDRWRVRKPFLLLGYGLAGLVRPLMGLATTFWHAAAIRFTDRLGKGIRGAPRDALIADITPLAQRGRAFGFHRAMDHAGAAIGPLLAFAFLWVWPDHLRALFLTALIPGVLVMLVVAFGVREFEIESPPPAPVASDADPIEPVDPAAPTAHGMNADTRKASAYDPRFRMLLLSIVVFALSNSTDGFLLLRAEQLGVPAVYLPLLWFGLHVAKSGANLLGGRLTDRYHPRTLVLMGWGIYAIVYLGFGFARNVVEVLALLALYALYYGLVEPAEKALVLYWVVPERRGTAFGWLHTAMGLSAFPASLAFGWIWDQPSLGVPWAFGGAALLSLGAAAILAFTYCGEPPQPPRVLSPPADEG